MNIRDLALQFVMTAKDNTSSVVSKISNGFSHLSNIVVGLVATLGRLASSTFGFEIPGISESTEAAEKLEVQMGKLRAAVTATGGAAGLTAEDLDAMARRLDEATLGSAEGFRNAAIELTTFKSVGIDAFERTLMAAQDLADAGFGTVESATVQLGKALEDPIKGLTALTRVGVSFTEEQKAMIENFVKLGDVASAQNVILAAVEGQVKGVASAAGGGLAGAVDLVGKRMTDLKETIGSILLPILTTLNLAWADVIGAVQKTASGLAGTLKSGAEQASGAIKSLATGIGEFISGAVKDLADWVARLDWSNVQAAADSTKERIAQLGTALSEMGSAGTKAVAVLSLGFNAIQSGFRTLAAGLLAITSGVVSTLATVEEAASKIGLGSLERANELRETANQMAGAAENITAKIAENGDAIKSAYDTLAGSTDVAAAAQKGLKDALPTVELQALNKSLADYEAIAQRAANAAKQAQQDFFAGKIGLEQLVEAADAAAQASNDLAAAQVAAATATKQADEATKAAAPTLKQQAENTKAAAESQTAYTQTFAQLQKAQRDGLQAEIDLAKARGDGLTVIQKSIDLARLEAEQAENLADVKVRELQVQEKAVEARMAELSAIKNKTDAEKIELEGLNLKIAALKEEEKLVGVQAEVAAATAELTAKTQEFVAAGYDEIEAKRLALLASGQFTAALKLEEEQRKKTTEAAEKQKDADAGIADALQAAVAAAESAAEAAKAAADQTQAASNFASSALQGWSDRLGALSGKARQEFNGYIEGAQGAADSSQELADAIAGLATGGYVEWANKVAIRALEIEQRFNGQKEAAQRLTEQLQAMADDGRVNMNAIAQATRGVSGEFDLLDQQDLSGLQSSIDAANAKLRQMQDEAREAENRLVALDARKLRAQGDTLAADLLEKQNDLTNDLTEATDRLNAAKSAGNRELIAQYEEEIRALKEVYALEVENLKSKAKASSDSSSSTSSSSSGSTSKSTTSSGASGGISSGGGGLTVNINASNARILDNTFVDELSRALKPKLDNLSRLNA